MAGRGPDVVTLNEVAAGDAADYKLKLQQASGQTWNGFHVKMQADGLGNMILSRYPIVSTASYKMQRNGAYARGIVEATIDAGGVRVSVFSLHVEREDSTIRMAQIREAVAWMAGFPGPRLVAGDLNAAPNAPELQPLFADYVDVWDAARASNVAFAYPDNPVGPLTRTQGTRIDYTLYSDRAGAVSVLASDVPDVRDVGNTNVKTKVGTADDQGVRPTDHNMLVSTLQIGPSTSGPDGVAPSISVAPPPNAQSLTGIVPLHADAMDDAGVLKVVWLIDGAPASIVRTPPYDFNWNTATVGLGSHAIEARAFDAAGNAASSGAIDVKTVAVPSASGNIVVYASDAKTIAGSWTRVDDSSAAGGIRLQNSDAAVAKLAAPVASPSTYLDVAFEAAAGTPYRLWIRGLATKDSYSNDSVFVQFSSSVASNGAPTYRIGSTSGVAYNLEDCSGCGLYLWGWQDDGYGTNVLGPTIVFATSGPQTMRIQPREDGLSIDQIVLSPSTYMTNAPGGLKNDATLLSRTFAPGAATDPPPVDPPAGGRDEIVRYAGRDATIIAGQWSTSSDPSAADGVFLQNADAGAAKLTVARETPSDYFEITFDADAGRPYRLWLRAKALGNAWANDSVFVQFSGAIDGNDATGAPIYRIGTTSSATVNLEDASGAGIAGWGWQDNGYGAGVMGPAIVFATAGPQTLRIQPREDGLGIDQVVLSAVKYLSSSPGALKNDTTVLAR